tara:strand:- start:353 stop:529 length:177 start_codon:yes stop_codon:yes gene_type:complete
MSLDLSFPLFIKTTNDFKPVPHNKNDCDREQKFLYAETKHYVFRLIKVEKSCSRERAL